ncbi:MAG TPA: hypothetical protein VL048_21145 [Xanthobacteraceae bacterium]|nr:hypothetical protein [Xanthobacteraceae bacterium]
MNEFEAFRRAVEIHRGGSWSPSKPDRPTLYARDDYRTIRQVCSLVANSAMDMPDETLDDLVSCLQERSPGLVQEVKGDRSFATGARCLLKLMDEAMASSLGSSVQ